LAAQRIRPAVARPLDGTLATAALVPRPRPQRRARARADSGPARAAARRLVVVEPLRTALDDRRRRDASLPPRPPSAPAGARARHRRWTLLGRARDGARSLDRRRADGGYTHAPVGPVQRASAARLCRRRARRRTRAALPLRLPKVAARAAARSF